jgi:hypothetical protein
MRRTEQSLRASRSTKDFDMREMAQIVVTDRPTAEPNWTQFAKSDLPGTNLGHSVAVKLVLPDVLSMVFPQRSSKP